jgi:hypothetical protein
LTPVSGGLTSTPFAPPTGAGAAAEPEVRTPSRRVARGRRRRRSSNAGSDAPSGLSDASPAPVENLQDELACPSGGGQASRTPTQDEVARQRRLERKDRSKTPAITPLPAPVVKPPLAPMLDVGVDVGGSFPSFTVMASALSDVDLLSLPGYGAATIELAALRGRWFTPRAIGRYLFGRELCVRLRFGAAVATDYDDKADVRPYVFRPTGQAVAAHVSRVDVTW